MESGCVISIILCCDQLRLHNCKADPNKLRALTGWRYYFGLFLKLADITLPLIRTNFAKITSVISFFLVCLIGRLLGLIIRQFLPLKCIHQVPFCVVLRNFLFHFFVSSYAVI